MYSVRFVKCKENHVVLFVFVCFNSEPIKVFIKSAFLEIKIQKVEQTSIKCILQDLSRLTFVVHPNEFLQNFLDFQAVGNACKKHHPTQVVAEGGRNLAKRL